jgi:hypothetical protein
VLLEIDPAYVDVIVRRWEKATGQNALLDGGDQNFGAATAIRRSMVVGAAAT